jgi:hypothetical protein
MIDGIDFLFAVLCLVLLFLLIEYWDWYAWDRDRRHQRKVNRRKNSPHSEVERSYFGKTNPR